MITTEDIYRVLEREHVRRTLLILEIVGLKNRVKVQSMLPGKTLTDLAHMDFAKRWALAQQKGGQ